MLPVAIIMVEYLELHITVYFTRFVRFKPLNCAELIEGIIIVQILPVFNVPYVCITVDPKGLHVF